MEYKFTDLNTPAIKSGGALETIINGINIDQKYAGEIKTIHADGRGLIAPTITATEKVGAAGSWVDDIQYPARTITIELLAKPSRDLFEKLNAEFGNNLNKITFTDDTDWEWSAILQEITADREVNREMVIVLGLLCPDPFKYKRASSMIETGQVSRSILFDTRPDSITVRPNTSTGQIKITNSTNGKNIVIRHSFSSGDSCTMDFQKQTIRKSSGANLLPDLDIYSDFETFSFRGGDTITVSPSATLNIRYREKSL